MRIVEIELSVFDELEICEVHKMALGENDCLAFSIEKVSNLTHYDAKRWANQWASEYGVPVITIRY